MNEFKSGDRVEFNVLDGDGEIITKVYGEGSARQKVCVSKKVHGLSATIAELNYSRTYFILDSPVRIADRYVKHVWTEVTWFGRFSNNCLTMVEKCKKSLNVGDRVCFNGYYYENAYFTAYPIGMCPEFTVIEISDLGSITVEGVREFDERKFRYNNLCPSYFDSYEDVSLLDILNN